MQFFLGWFQSTGNSLSVRIEVLSIPTVKVVSRVGAIMAWMSVLLPAGAAEVLDLMVNLQKELGTAIALITHDMGVVARFCDVVTVMYRGSVVEHGPTAEILTDPQHEYTRGLLAAVPRRARH